MLSPMVHSSEIVASLYEVLVSPEVTIRLNERPVRPQITSAESTSARLIERQRWFW